MKTRLLSAVLLLVVITGTSILQCSDDDDDADDSSGLGDDDSSGYTDCMNAIAVAVDDCFIDRTADEVCSYDNAQCWMNCSVGLETCEDWVACLQSECGLAGDDDTSSNDDDASGNWEETPGLSCTHLSTGQLGEAIAWQTLICQGEYLHAYLDEWDYFMEAEENWGGVQIGNQAAFEEIVGINSDLLPCPIDFETYDLLLVWSHDSGTCSWMDFCGIYEEQDARTAVAFKYVCTHGTADDNTPYHFVLTPKDEKPIDFHFYYHLEETDDDSI